MSTNTSAYTAANATGAGIFQGANPILFSKADPLRIFIIQAVIIILFCRILHWPLKKIRQPRVIAEVIGGIILGPTVMGRIPHFNQSIFPTESLTQLSLVANIGLVLFLFLVGLEVDIRVFTRNLKIAALVSSAGIVLPFGLGCGVAYWIFQTYGVENDNVSLGIFCLFIGVAMAITAFPVLARILTELKLLRTAVGVIVLSAGVGNDVIGWILLALSIALVTAGSGITCLWIFLSAVAWTLLLFLLIKPLYLRLARWTQSIDNGPTESIMMITLILVFASAFFTDVIGVHAIFGGFLVGLILPRENGYHVRVTEKLEDFISALFLPLYFALSGLKTNIGLLNDGTAWAITIVVILVALSGKMVGTTLAARLSGLFWRESAAIGILMSCKGLVELIVLNIGLSANILTQKIFTIFVVMALVTTFLTTPLTLWVYNEEYRKKADLMRYGIEGSNDEARGTSSPVVDKDPLSRVSKVMVVLNRISYLPSVMTLTKLLGSSFTFEASEQATPRVDQALPESFKVHSVRLLELTDRTSAVMKSAEEDLYAKNDSVLRIFRTFSILNKYKASESLMIVPQNSYSDSIALQSQAARPDLLIVGWSGNGQVTDNIDSANTSVEMNVPDFGSHSHNDYIQGLINQASCNVGILIDRGLDGTKSDRYQFSRTVSRSSLRSGAVSKQDVTTEGVKDTRISHNVFVPFIGGVDDRLAALYAAQMAADPSVRVLIVHICYSESASDDTIQLGASESEKKEHKRDSSIKQHDSISKSQGDLVLTDISEQETTEDLQFLEELEKSLSAKQRSRITIQTVESRTPMHSSIYHAKKFVYSRVTGSLIITGRSTPANAEVIKSEVGQLQTTSNHIGIGAESRKCLGILTEGLVMSKIPASILVISQSTPSKS